nr:class I tRNA ligase family protein [Thermoleophilaceae bacterium]
MGPAAPDGEGWARDPDVLDTWFSSGLWPFATLGWPEPTPELQTFYPSDVLSTARDIIFLWVARMVMFGMELTGELPFRDVPIHSVVQAPDGRRMSKSLGTGIDPLELIGGGPRPPVYAEGGEFPAYGADALRFGLMAMSSSQDVRFNEERVGQGRDLANKLWNASRLVLLRVGEAAPDAGAAETVEDRWIVSRLERLTAGVTEHFDAFRFSPAVLELYAAFWSEVCDWYLEMAKPRLYADDNARVSAVLLHALERMLILLHPVMPFVTEEIWSLLPRERGLLAGSAWPEHQAGLRDESAEADVGRLIEAVSAMRRYRDEVGARAGVPVRGVLEADGYEELHEQLARLGRFELVPSSGGEDRIAGVEIPGGVVHVLPSAAFDTGEAEARREKERA